MDKVNGDIKKEVGSAHAYNKGFLKTKTKSHDDEVRDIYDKIIPKVNSNYTFLAEIPWILLSRKMAVIIRKCF